MANNTHDNNQNPQDRKDNANVNDPNRDRRNDGGRDQQQAEQGKQGPVSYKHVPLPTNREVEIPVEHFS